MVLRSCPRCRAIAEIVQPRRCNACASTSSSRVIIGGGGPFGPPVVRDQQPRRDLRRLCGATRVGKFSEQVWGASPERRHSSSTEITYVPAGDVSSLLGVHEHAKRPGSSGRAVSFYADPRRSAACSAAR